MCYEYQHHEFLNWIFGSFIESLRGDALAWSPRVNVVGVLVSTPRINTLSDWSLRRDLREPPPLLRQYFRVSPHQNHAYNSIFDPLIAHSSCMVTGLKTLISYR